MEIHNDCYCVYVHINKINWKMYVGQTCKRPDIIKCCRGKINSFKGFIWCYADDPIQPDPTKIITQQND